MKALVTGATGFIGGALAAELIQQGWEVNLLIRPSRQDRLLDICSTPIDPERCRVFQGDLAKPDGLPCEVVEGCDVLFHAAAIRDRWGTSYELYRQVNVAGTQRLLEASLGRVRRFVYVSSVGVFGAPGLLGIDETFPVLAPEPSRGLSGKAGYHATKAEAERLVMAKGREIEAVVVRPTITYGPGDQDGMLTRLVSLIAEGKFLRIGGGKNHFHLTYIDDLVRGLVLAATHSAASGETFILAGPRSIAVQELVHQIEGSLGRSPRTVFVPGWLAYPLASGVESLYRIGMALRIPAFDGIPPLTRDKIDTLCLHRSFSSRRAGSLLGYSPRVDYTEGIDRTIEWLAATGRLSHLSQTGAARPPRPTQT